MELENGTKTKLNKRRRATWAAFGPLKKAMGFPKRKQLQVLLGSYTDDYTHEGGCQA